MTFEEFIGDRVNVLSPQEYHAVEAVWNYQQKIIGDFKQSNNDLAKAAIRPDGYVLVPVEPTEKMIEAGDALWDHHCTSIYEAMIQAAQK